MTFIPSVLSNTDQNNSQTFTGSFTGTYSSTIGYNCIQVNITSNTNSAPSGIEIKFSSSNTSDTNVKTITDTYLTGSGFNKRYNILDKYYKIIYTQSTPSVTSTISSRLCTDSLNSENNSLNAFDNNNEYKIDSFGKLRVSNPYTLLDIRFPYTLDTGSGFTGATGFLNNSSQISLGTTGIGVGYTGSYTVGGSILSMHVEGNGNYISQSRNYCTYQPGKSLLFKASCVMDSNVYNGYTANNSPGVKSRVGYFDAYNGLYFEYDSASGVSVCVISNGSIATSINQTSWNIDTMDGNGTSGINLNFTKAQLFIIDLEWLGVGRVRFGFYVYGKILYCHEITNINALFIPYALSINLPITYSITSNANGQIGTITQICSTVISEGGYNPIGKSFSASAIGITGDTTEKIVLMLRGGNSNYYHQNIVPYSIEIVDSTNNNVNLYRIRIYRDGNSPIAGAITWTNADTNSVAQYAVSTSGLVTTNSTIVFQALFSGKGVVQVNDLSSTFTTQVLQVTANLLNVSDILVITSQIVSGTSSSLYCTLNWSEYY